MVSGDPSCLDRRALRIGGLTVGLYGPGSLGGAMRLPGLGLFACTGEAEPDVRIFLGRAGAPALRRRLHTFTLSTGMECQLHESEAGLPVYTFGDGGMVACSADGEATIDCRHTGGDLLYMLWLAYAHAALRHNAVPVHASAVVCGGEAVLCLGESGTGKSTHTRLWLDNIEGSSLLNDDSPVVRVEHGRVVVYGSPWSGKTPCFRTESYPVAAFVRLRQAPANSIARLDTLHSFAALQPSCPPTFMHHDRSADALIGLVGEIIERVPVYRLDCLPDAAAARLCHGTVTKQRRQ